MGLFMDRKYHLYRVYAVSKDETEWNVLCLINKEAQKPGRRFQSLEGTVLKKTDGRCQEDDIGN